MGRVGAIHIGDLVGRLDMLRVSCRKCPRAGQYSVGGLTRRHGPDKALTDWLVEVSADRSRRQQEHASIYDLCGACCPDLVDVF